VVAESFSLELEKLVGPYMEEFTQQMGKLMENLMGGNDLLRTVSGFATAPSFIKFIL